MTCCDAFSSTACNQALSTWHCLVQVLGMDLLKSGFFSVLPWITMAISANVSSFCTPRIHVSRALYWRTISGEASAVPAPYVAWCLPEGHVLCPPCDSVLPSKPALLLGHSLHHLVCQFHTHLTCSLLAAGGRVDCRHTRGQGSVSHSRTQNHADGEQV